MLLEYHGKRAVKCEEQAVGKKWLPKPMRLWRVEVPLALYARAWNGHRPRTSWRPIVPRHHLPNAHDGKKESRKDQGLFDGDTTLARATSTMDCTSLASPAGRNRLGPGRPQFQLCSLPDIGRYSYMASIVTDRLLAPNRNYPNASPFPIGRSRPRGGWMTSSHPANILANWAIFLDRLPGEDNPFAEKPAALLEQALHASPINATARLARAEFRTT